MEFIQHSINWCKGEILESTICGLYGLGTILASLLLWKTGTTPLAKALFVPLLAVGLFYGIVGASLIMSNKNRITSFQESYASDPAAFQQAEKTRMETLVKTYPVSMPITAFIIVTGLVLFFFWGGATGRSVAFGLILFAFSFIVLDSFSEERAREYHNQIMK